MAFESPYWNLKALSGFSKIVFGSYFQALKYLATIIRKLMTFKTKKNIWPKIIRKLMTSKIFKALKSLAKNNQEINDQQN